MKDLMRGAPFAFSELFGAIDGINVPGAFTVRFKKGEEISEFQRGVDCVGTHDFAAFAAAGGSAKTTVRTLDRLSVTRAGEEVTMVVHGNAFLYNMVRIIAGALIYIGHGKLPEDCLTQALQSGSRLDLGVTAPACGLELTYVEYDFEKK